MGSSQSKDPLTSPTLALSPESPAVPTEANGSIPSPPTTNSAFFDVPISSPSPSSSSSSTCTATSSSTSSTSSGPLTSLPSEQQNQQNWTLSPVDIFSKKEPEVAKRLNDNNVWTDARLNARDVEGAQRIQFQEKVRALVAGKTGAGKSRLISATLGGTQLGPRSGNGAPITAAAALDQEWTYEGSPLIVHDSKGFELMGNVIEETMNWVRERASDPGRCIHVIWYCIPVCGSRFEQAEADFIQNVGVPTIVVLTKRDAGKQQEEDDLRLAVQTMAPKVRGIFRSALNGELGNYVELHDPPTSCPACQTTDICMRARNSQWFCERCREDNIKGPLISDLRKLIEATCRSLTSNNLRQAFMAAQSVNVKEKLDRSMKVLIGMATGAGLVGITPFPFPDPLLLIPMQLTMIYSLASIWEIRKSLYTISRLFLSQVLTQGLIRFAVRFTGTFLGAIGGNPVSGVMASALTLAVGVVYTAGFCKAWRLGWNTLSDEEFQRRLREVINPEHASEVMARIQQNRAFTTESLLPLLEEEAANGNPDWAVSQDDDEAIDFFNGAIEIHKPNGSK